MGNPEYQHATFRAAGSPADDLDAVFLALNTPPGDAHSAIRVKLPLDEAERAALDLLNEVAIQRYRRMCSQSSIWSGNPSADGSPQDGQSVCPPAKSSSACCGEG